MTLAQRARAATDRRTAKPREAYERNLACTSCHVLTAVYEASTGASTAAEHQHLEPATYTCAPCLTKKSPVAGAPQ